MGEIPEIFESLPDGSTLKACGPEAVCALARVWSEIPFAARASILAAEDESRDVYFVLAGAVRAATFSAAGREVAFSDLGPGAIFGEIGAIDGGPRSTNVIAATDSLLARLSGRAFAELIDANAELRWAILRYLASRVRSLSAKMLDVTTMNARERLVAHLLHLAEATGGNTAEIAQLPTQQALADAILGQREAVGREMSRLRDEGLIDRQGRRLTILNLAEMRARLIRL